MKNLFAAILSSCLYKLWICINRLDLAKRVSYSESQDFVCLESNKIKQSKWPEIEMFDINPCLSRNEPLRQVTDFQPHWLFHTSNTGCLCWWDTHLPLLIRPPSTLWNVTRIREERQRQTLSFSSVTQTITRIYFHDLNKTHRLVQFALVWFDSYVFICSLPTRWDRWWIHGGIPLRPAPFMKIKKVQWWELHIALLCISGDVMCSSRTRCLMRGKTHFISLILPLSYYLICD